MTGTTTLLGLALPVEGDLDGTWGDVVNESITSLLDSAIAGTTTLSANASVILSNTPLEANQARQAIIRWTASNGVSTRFVTAPALSKPYILINAGTGSFTFRGNTSPTPTTGITVVPGERCVAAWSGTDFVKIASNQISTLSGILAVANGGTGVGTSTGTGGSVVLSDNPSIDNLFFTGGYTELVDSIVDGAAVDLDPDGGTVQTWTLGANRSPTATFFESGQSMTLMIDDGAAYAITWPSVTWKTDGGSPPVLNATGYTVIQLWKVDTVLYGARVGDN